MNCCVHEKNAKMCVRKTDKKRFDLPRRFTRKQCLGKIKGFSMRSSCAPYKGCKRKSNARKSGKRKKINKVKTY